MAIKAKQKSNYITLPSRSYLVQPEKRKGPLELAFNAANRDEADKDCARAAYRGAIPFDFVRNPWLRSWVQKIGNSQSVGSPTYDWLYTTLLTQEKAYFNRLLDPIRDTWARRGTFVCSDEWSDIQQRPVINIITVSSGGVMFIKAIDSSYKMKDAEYVAILFIEAIEKIGPDNIV